MAETATDPWMDALQSATDDQKVADDRQLKAAIAAAPVGASSPGPDIQINKAGPGPQPAPIELPPQAQPASPPVITGNAQGVSSGVRQTDPWEAAFSQAQLHSAVMKGNGQDLTGLLRQADRTGAIGPAPQQPAPPPPSGPQYDPNTPWGQARQRQFDNEGVMGLVQHDHQVGQRWADEYGSALVDQNNAAFQKWARAAGRDANDPHAAADYLRQTLPPQMVQETQKRFELETTWMEGLRARDQIARGLIGQIEAQHPGLTDDAAVSTLVHQRMQQLGVPDDGTFPPVRIQQGQVVPPQVSDAQGAVNALMKGAGAIVYAPAELLEGIGQAVADRTGGPGASGAGRIATMRNATLESDARWQQLNPSGTAARTDPGWHGTMERLAEGGAGLLPSVAAVGATSGAGAAGGSGLFGLGGGTLGARAAAEAVNYGLIGLQQGGQSFNEIYDTAIKGGASQKQASAAAAVGGTIDGALNAYLMKFGVMDSAAKAGLRSYLGNIVKTSLAQGGVGAAQDLVSQMANYAATGKSIDFERIMAAGRSNLVAGAVFAAANPAGFKAAYDRFTGATTAEAQSAAADAAAGRYGRGGTPDADARQLLGLDPKAPFTAEDLKAAYRKAAMETHPDRIGPDGDKAAAEAAFKRVADAYNSLKPHVGQKGAGKPTTPAQPKGGGPPPTEQQPSAQNAPMDQTAAGKPAAEEPAAAGARQPPEKAPESAPPAPQVERRTPGGQPYGGPERRYTPQFTPAEAAYAKSKAGMNVGVEGQAGEDSHQSGPLEHGYTPQATPAEEAYAKSKAGMNVDQAGGAGEDAGNKAANKTEAVPPPAAVPTDAEILSDQQKLVDLRGKLQRGELAGADKAAAEKNVDHLAAVIQEKHARYGEAHGEDAGEDLFEKMSAVAESRTAVQTKAHGHQNPESSVPVESGNEPAEGRGRDAARHEGDAGEGRGEAQPGEGQEQRQGPGRGQRELGKKSLWPELDAEVDRAEQHERVARQLQKSAKGVSDDDAHDMVRSAVEAARLGARSDDPDAPTQAVLTLLDDKRFTGDEVPPELTRSILKLAGVGKPAESTEPAEPAEPPEPPAHGITVGDESDGHKWDFQKHYPNFLPEVLEDDGHEKVLGEDREGTHEESVKFFHDQLIDGLSGIAKARKAARESIVSGKGPGGKPLTLKERKALTDAIAKANADRDDLLVGYGDHFGQEAQDALAAHVGDFGSETKNALAAHVSEGDNTAVKTNARDMTPTEGGLLAGLSSMSGWEQRWSKIRSSGADDEQVREFIAREFGIAGGGGVPKHGASVDYKGGNDPEITIRDRGGKIETLRGNKLIAEARRLLGIGQPGQTPPELPYVTDEVLPGRDQEPATGGADGGGSQGALEAKPSGASPATVEPGAAGQRGKSSGGKRKGPLRPPGGAGSGPEGGDGGREGDVHHPVGGPAAGRDGQSGGGDQPGGGVTPAAAERAKESASPANAGNFQVNDPAFLEAGGARTKFKNNVAAIELLRKIQGEGRERATPAEQEILARFSGWGQFPQVFNDFGEHGGEDARKWDAERAIVKDLLGDHFEAARRSTLNAHYTSPYVVQTIYQALARMGFEGGRILEPSMGAGIFFGMIPPEMNAQSSLSGVELDPTTGAIARLLYPDANVQVKGFQDVVIPDGFYDAAVGNVPFGDIRVHDKAYNKFKAPIHDYFILKTLDKVRPGGVVALITSTGTLDKASGEHIRAAIAERGDLLAAARLPEGAFAKSAGTQVVTDLLVFRRRAEGDKPGESITGFAQLPDADGGEPIDVNEYFGRHPDHVLGALDRKSRLYNRGSMHVSRTDDFEARLADWLKQLPTDGYRPAAASPTFKKPRKLVSAKTKDGGFVYEKGKVYQRKGEGLEEAAQLDKKAAAIVADTLKVRDALREVINGQLEKKPEQDLAAARKALRAAYDAFVKKNGPLTKKANAVAFSDDPDAPVVLAMEKSYDAKTGKVELADVFTKNTVRGYTKPEKADDIGSALGISLNETASVDLDRMTELLGKSEAEVGKMLVAKGLAFRDPAGGWKSAEQYLSGNVRKKLLEAMEAAAADPTYEPNVAALEKVIPADVDYDQIGVRLGSSWVPPGDVQQFAAHVMGGLPEHFAVHHLHSTGAWMADYTPTGKRRHSNSPNERQLWGTERAPFPDIIEAALNSKTIRITDPGPEKDSRVLNVEASEAANAKVRDLQDAFAQWIWHDDARRARLHRYYNDTFNNIAPIKYNGAHQTYPGMNPLITFRDHQGNAVWQIVSSGTALLAHEVGTGKTFTIIAAAMELRRLGLARKPAVAVPKKTLSGFVKQARLLYPDIRLHVIDDFSAKGRKAAVSKISTGDYDLVVMTHDHLNMLPMDPEVKADFIRREQEELREVILSAQPPEEGNAYGRKSKKSDNRVVKELEKQMARLEARLQEALDGKKDNAVTFEQTGIDQLFVDEAHAYKSLPVYTRHQRVKGIPANASDRATDMWMRAQWLQQQHNGRGLVFATGTPVTNSMVEVYVMQRFLQMKELEDRGVAAFDAWASTFGTLNTRIEYGVTGEYSAVTRFNAFVNLPELQRISRQAIDVQRAKSMPGFKRPKRIDSVSARPMSADQLAYMGVIRERAVAAKKKRPGEKGDNMLSISTDGRKSSIDYRLIDPKADGTGGKIDVIAQSVLSLLRENPGTTQMVFCDYGLHPSKQSNFQFFQALAAKLAEGGIPADKIVNFTTITEAKQKGAEQRLNNGDAIIGFASSQAGGTGINVQDHLLALHHADVPWTPGFVEQRDGRGWRQGNVNPQVKIIRYVTEGSFDTFMWQTVDAKARFIQQFLDGDNLARAVAEEDGEELSHAQVMALSTGNPLMLEKINLESEVTQLEKAAQRHQRGDLKLRDTAADLRDKVRRSDEREKDITGAVAAARDRADDAFEIRIAGRQFTERTDADEALASRIAELPISGKTTPAYSKIGDFKGFELAASRHYDGSSIRMDVAGVSVFPTASVASIEYYARPAYWEGRLGEVLNKRKIWNSDLARIEQQIGKPFPHGEVLKSKKATLADVIGRIKAKADADSGVQPPAQPASAVPMQAEQEFRDRQAANPYGMQGGGGGSGSGAASIAQQPTATPVKLTGTARGAAASPGRRLLRPIAMPELIKLARQLMKGGVPLMKKLPKAVGRFSDKGGNPLIRIDPRRAKGAQELAAVLAHELGHLEDWLPDGVLARGNLIGRIQKLHGYMKQSFGTMGVTNKELRAELIKLSEWWSPYDPKTVPPGYVNYRNSPRELYAQALSVLLNAPGEVEDRAPAFYQEFLDALDQHRDFRDAYLDLQDLLAGTPEEIAASRRSDVREAYAKGEDILKARTAERIAAAAGRPLTAIRQLLLDSMTPAIQLQRKVEKKLGRQLADSENPERAWAELAYADNENHLWLKKVDAKVHAPLLKAGLTPEDMGEYLQMVRTQSERAEMANPQGHTPETAGQMLKDLENRLGQQKYADLVELAKTFHELVHDVVEAAADVGYYNAKQYKDLLEPNKYRYATFAVLDHLQDHIGAGVMQQVGTFKDVANPYTATMLKTMSLWRAVQRQKAVVPAIQMLKSHFPDDIEKGKPVVGAGGRRSEPARKPVGKDWLVVHEDGHPEWYAVDPYLARMYQSHDIGMLNQVGKVLQRITYGTLHPLYVVFNLGWHLRLISKDFIRTYRNTAYQGNPTTVREILAAYARAIPSAYRRARGKDDPLIDQMLQDKALDVPWKDYDFNDAHDSYERLLDRYGMGEGEPGRHAGAVQRAARAVLPGRLVDLPFKVLHAIEAAGAMMVATPKIAGWHMLTARGIDGGERAFRVRNHMGHPDRRRRGLGTNMSNGLAMYSNILIQFLRADYNAGVQDPTTRAGWWWRTLLTTILPKALMAAGAAGLLGAWLKKHFDLIPEADKSKNLIIPLWNVQDESGKSRKAVYVAIPQDAAGTLIGGTLWKTLHKNGEPWIRKIMGAFDVPYADGPHLNPYIQSAMNWYGYARGQNPMDDYRQRQIISDQDMKAGGWYAAKDMLAWQLNQFGVLSTLGHGVITRAVGKPEGMGEKETTTETVLGSIPGINSYVKISDRGIREGEELDAALHEGEQARLHLSLGDDVLAAVRERYRLELIKSHDTDPEDATRRARLAGWYDQFYLPITKAIKAAVDRGDQQTAARLRARLSETTSQLH